MQPVLAERCMQLGGERQDLTVQVPVPEAGLLHVEIRERGISAAAELSPPSAAEGPATSPVLRWGAISLARNAPRRGPVALRIRSVDSPDATGDVCLAADLVSPPDDVLAGAARASSDAAVETFRHDWQSAFDRYLAAARLYDRAGARKSSAISRTAMAEIAHRYLRRDRDSEALLSAVLSEPVQPEPAVLAARLMLLAKTLAESPDHGRQFNTLLDRSAALFQTTPRGTRELPWIEILRGFQRYSDQDLGGSRALFERAAAQCERSHDSECLAGARQNLAAIAEVEQNYPEALSEYEAALRALDQSRSTMLAADVSDNLGRLEGRIGLIRRGEAADRNAMRLYARVGDCDGTRRAASTLGEMLVHIGSIGDAGVYLNAVTTLDCRELFSSVNGGSLSSGRTTIDAVNALPQFGAKNSSAALRLCLHRPALNALTLDGDVAVFHALLASSDMAQLDGQVAEAQRCLDLAREYAVDPRREIRLANARGQLLLQTQMPNAARTAFALALHLTDEAGLSQSSEYRGAALLGLADAALRTGDLSEAQRDSYAALQLSSGRADVSRIVAALRLIASMERESGRSVSAEELLRSAIRLLAQVPTAELDPETRAMYLATQHDVYAELTDLLADEASEDSHSGRRSTWGAFAVADEGHSRSVRYALDQASVGTSTEGGGGAAQGYRQLMQRISDLASSGARTALRGALTERIQRLGLSEPNEPVVDPQELARSLHDMHAVLVEYAAGDRNLYAFVVDESGLAIVGLGRLDLINRAAGDFISQLRSAEPDPDGIRAAAQRLAAQVLWPLTRYIHSDRIFLVPEDALHTVPFAALPWSDAGAQDLTVRHAEITVVPSALFVERRAAGRYPGTQVGPFVLIGDPVIRSTTWSRTCARSPASVQSLDSTFDWMRLLPSLPGTRDEVLAVARQLRRSYASASVLTLLGCAATPMALRADGPRAELLHIATHGLVDARRPRLSTLVLTPDASPPDDGAVQLLDIVRMPLRARLVVLSACDTSAGRLLPGEGVLGLAQAFLEAGAASVMASYWRVEDAATAQFMAKFYQHLLSDHLPAAAALRQTQLDQAGANDYSWAAFALYGHPDAAL